MGRLGFVFVVAGERQAVALAGLVEPARVARIHDEPAAARGDEPRVRLLELRSGTTVGMIGRGLDSQAA